LETNARSCGFGGGSLSFIALVEAGFLVEAIMKDENVNETNKQSKKEEEHANNMKNIGTVEFVP
jgi:hypothetical protein